MNFTLKQIIDACQGVTFGNYDNSTVLSHFIFDSRSLVFPATTLFIALRSESSDGHRYISRLLAQGVSCFLVEEVPSWAKDYTNCCFIKVDNTADALVRLAASARERINGQVVAITGSQGKTVVKEMIHSLAPDSVWRSPRSWNSRLGVPMSLLEADENAKICVFEAGIDRPGEMKYLERILRSEVVIFTGITDEHSVNFPGLKAKINEKLKLVGHSTKALIYNSLALTMEDIHDAGISDIELIGESGLSTRDTDIKLAEATLKYCGIAFTHRMLPMASNRLDVHEGVNGCTIVYDGFTYDLRSLSASLDFMRRRSSAHLSTTVVLGDFSNNSSHISQLPLLLEAFGVSRVIAVGNNIAECMASRPLPFAVETIESADAFVEKYDINQFSSENILIAGGAEGQFLKIKTELESARHDTILEVNLDAIIHNFNEYRKRIKPTTGMIAMVKASAYGLGATEIARTLQAQGAAYLAVAVIDEGVELRRQGITMPIVVLNPVTTNYRALFANKLEPSVFSLGELHTLLKEAKKAGIKRFKAHIKLDTGMHRVGFTEPELEGLAAALINAPEIEVASIFSHLATADCPDQSDYTITQLNTFEKMSSYLLERLPYPVKRHILNTAGIATHPEYQYDMVRLGIGLYGVNPLPSEAMDLRQVANLKTTLISLKKWPAGTTIGYGRRGVLSRPSVIATVPIGYADGLDRHLSRGVGAMTVRGVRCPIVGNICMDQCMIDVTDVANAAPGDVAEIFGDSITVEALADTLGTIPYEVLTSISPRVNRVYFRD